MSKHDQPEQGSHEAVRNFYDGEYYAQPASSNGLSWHSRAIATRLGDLNGKRVLDIACGAGEWLAELKHRGANPSGIDISTRAVERCRRLLPGADVRVGVAEALPFHDAAFDIITCMGSLEHFLDQPGALAEMRRVGTPSARFLILVPNSGFLTRRLGLYKGTQQVAVRETARSLSEWQAMISDADMAVTERWRDLHPLCSGWIKSGPFFSWPIRAAQACALAVWPLFWQYQVYFYCEAKA